MAQIGGFISSKLAFVVPFHEPGGILFGPPEEGGEEKGATFPQTDICRVWRHFSLSQPGEGRLLLLISEEVDAKHPPVHKTAPPRPRMPPLPP